MSLWNVISVLKLLSNENYFSLPDTFSKIGHFVQSCSILHKHRVAYSRLLTNYIIQFPPYM